MITSNSGTDALGRTGAVAHACTIANVTKTVDANFKLRMGDENGALDHALQRYRAAVPPAEKKAAERQARRHSFIRKDYQR